MNEPKDDLLAAFENPESAPVTETPVQQPVALVTDVPAAPVAEAPVIPDVPYTPENTVAQEIVSPVAPVSADNIMPAEFQNAPEATPIPAAPVAPAPAPVAETQAAPVAPEPVAPIPAAPVAEAPVAENNATDNQNVPDHVSEEPAITVKNTITPENEDSNSLKKNIVFIVIFAIIIVFLPQIRSLIIG